jgi:hypothetical protein
MEKPIQPEPIEIPLTKEEDKIRNQAMIKQQLIQAMIAFHGLENA